MGKKSDFACKRLRCGRYSLLQHGLTHADKHTCLEHLALPLLSTTQHLCFCEVLVSSTPALLIFPRALPPAVTVGPKTQSLLCSHGALGHTLSQLPVCTSAPPSLAQAR